MYWVIEIFYKSVKLGDEKIHEPTEQQSSHDHDKKKRNKVSDLRFPFLSADDSQNKADK